jgi:hypothetical protein
VWFVAAEHNHASDASAAAVAAASGPVWCWRTAPVADRLELKDWSQTHEATRTRFLTTVTSDYMSMSVLVPQFDGLAAVPGTTHHMWHTAPVLCNQHAASYSQTITHILLLICHDSAGPEFITAIPPNAPFVVVTAQQQADSDVTTTSSSTAPAVTAPPALYQKILDLHNSYRADHGAPPLVWNVSLAQSATRVAGTCKYEHSNMLNVGR